jgi:hypothetical protein
MGWGRVLQPCIGFLVLCLPACRDSRQGAPEPAAEPAPAAAVSCGGNSDCPETWICLAGKCTDPSEGAIYSDPSNAVTPDKVEREMEQLGQQRDQDIDRRIEGAEGTQVPQGGTEAAE